MSTLNSESVKTAYRKLVWYDSSTKKLMYSPADVDTQLDDAKISGSFTVSTISEIGSDTDKFLMSDSGVIKFVTGTNLRTYIGAGTSSVASLNDLSDVTYSSGDLTISSIDTIISGALTIDSSGDIGLSADGGNVTMDDGTNTIFDFDVDGTSMTIHDDEDTGDKFTVTVAQHGATTLSTVDDDAAAAHITIDPDGNTIFPNLTSSKKVQFKEASTDHSLDIYHDADDVIFGHPDNHAVFNAGTSKYFELWYDGALRERVLGQSYSHQFHYGSNDYFAIQLHNDGQTDLVTANGGVDTNADLNIIADGEMSLQTATDHHIKLGSGTGFDRSSYTDAADVTVDFRDSNKAHLDMTGGSISGTLTLQFPAVSGNFVLVVQQDSSARTIAAYATKDAAGNAGNNDGGTGGAVRWQGGSAPDLTDGGNKRDILSFYWDATEEVCYGVASLNF